ncbi:MAG: hypothetical protein AAF846_28805 [Chloroflexota bacterium]
MSTATRTKGRVNIETNVRDIYESLSKGSNPLSTPFRTMKDVFVLAACIGFEKGIRRPLEGGKHQPFHYAQLSEPVDIPLLKAIAIATTDDITTLADLDEVVAIAEEFANEGINDIRQYVLEHPGEPLWNLVEAIR